MKFTFQMFWENPKAEIEPFLSPLTLDLPSVEKARTMFGEVVRHPKVPVHSLTIVSEDGAISERWFQIDGAWRRKEASKPND